VIALLGLFDLGQIGLEFFGRVPGRAVDALQHRIVLVAAPVCAGHAHQLDRADLARALGVTAAAQIGEIADRVQCHGFALRDRLGQFDLVGVARKSLDGLGARDGLAGHFQIGGDDRAHPLFQATEVLGRERLAAIKVVIKPVFDRRTDGRLGLGKEFLDGVGEDVGGRVTQRGQRGFVGVGIGHTGGRFGNRPRRSLDGPIGDDRRRKLKAPIRRL